jgi:hypothetical protein
VMKGPSGSAGPFPGLRSLITVITLITTITDGSAV